MAKLYSFNKYHPLGGRGGCLVLSFVLFYCLSAQKCTVYSVGYSSN